MSVAPLTLHTVATANGQKAQIALEAADLPYVAVSVDLVAGEHKTPAFRALNPFGKAPVLIDPDGPEGRPIVLAETLAIAWYVAEKGGGALLPASPHDLAELRMWAAALSSSVAMPFAMQFFETHLAPTPDPFRLEVMTAGCRASLDALEARMKDRTFLMGERFTLGDCLLFPIVATSAARVFSGLDDWPSLSRYRETAGALPAVRRGMRPPALS